LPVSPELNRLVSVALILTLGPATCVADLSVDSC
jgi:hypothetical protein